jgi:protein-disulfide isomerase
MAEQSKTGPARIALFALGAVLLGVLGALIAGWTGLTRPTTNVAVREYLLEHPEVLPEAMDRLKAREVAKRIDPIRSQVTTPFPGAVLGNPAGTKVLVEFTDFACTYCRHSVAEVDALIAQDPQLKVVIREMPILSEQSAAAARMGLAAAEQGKYAAFHKAMFELGPPSPSTIDAAAQKAGLDLARAKTIAGSKAVEAELGRNLAIAERLNFNGTPSWVIGDQAFSGALPRDALAEALEKAEAAKGNTKG